MERVQSATAPEVIAECERVGMQAVRKSLDTMPLSKRNGEFAVPGMGEPGHVVFSRDAEKWWREKRKSRMLLSCAIFGVVAAFAIGGAITLTGGQIESLGKFAVSVAWPALFALVIFKFSEPVRELIASARTRKFSVKIAGNELSVEQASEIQVSSITDLLSKVATIEKRLGILPTESEMPVKQDTSITRRILWVDDQPKNNSLLIASLNARGYDVETALTTQEAIQKCQTGSYGAVISDMGRPEGGTAGIALATSIRETDKTIPIYIFCGPWAATNLKAEAEKAGVNGITSSSTTLLSHF